MLARSPRPSSRCSCSACSPRLSGACCAARCAADRRIPSSTGANCATPRGDLGLPAADTRTPRELAAAWGASWTPDQLAALEGVRLALEARAFAAPTPAPVPEAGRAGPGRDADRLAVDTVLAALRGSVPRWRQALATVAPVSLLDRTPVDELLPAPPLAT
jgi:hypothetical protein